MSDLKNKDNGTVNLKKAAADDGKSEDVAASSSSGSDHDNVLGAAVVIFIICTLYCCYTISGSLLAMAMDLLFVISKVIAFLMAALFIAILKEKAYRVKAGEQKPNIPDDHNKPNKATAAAADDAGKQKSITDDDHNKAGEQKPIPDGYKPIKAASVAAAAGGRARKQQSTPYGNDFKVFRNLTLLIFLYMNYNRLYIIGKELLGALVMAIIIAIPVVALLMTIHDKTETVLPDHDNNQIHNDIQDDQKIIGDDSDVQKRDHDNDHIDKAEEHRGQLKVPGCSNDIQKVIGGGVEQKHDVLKPASMELKYKKPLMIKKKPVRHYKTEAFLEGLHEGTNAIVDLLTGNTLFSFFNR